MCIITSPFYLFILKKRLNYHNFKFKNWILIKNYIWEAWSLRSIYSKIKYKKILRKIIEYRRIPFICIMLVISNYTNKFVSRLAFGLVSEKAYNLCIKLFYMWILYNYEKYSQLQSKPNYNPFSKNSQAVLI